MIDTDADTSYLGEYSNRPESKYSIDRAHSADCQSLELNHGQAVEQLERIISHLSDWRTQAGSDSENTEWESLDESLDVLAGLQSDLQECDCSGHVSSREYRYFNPNHENYQGLSDAEIHQYCRQDYERMESLNAGNWSYVGVRAEAKITIPSDKIQHTSVIQRISSGGIFGIESDSETSYFSEVSSDELSELKTLLTELGFSKRAIASAFKNVRECDE